LLEGPLAACARAVVGDIAAALRDRPVLPGVAGIIHRAELSILFSRLGGKDDGDLAVRHLESAMDQVAEVEMQPGLYGGFTFVAWTVTLLTGKLLAPPDDEAGDPCAGIDEALETLLGAEPFPGDNPHDLIFGLAGIGVYALERLPRPAAARCLRAVIARLAQLAVDHPDGAAWETPQRFGANKPPGTLDLGLAHGVAGVIGMLGAACAHGFVEARPLLGRAVSFLLAQERHVDGSCFPYAILPGIPLRPARAAWCYGDPGIAAALLIAARGAGEPAWEEAARRFARAAAVRPMDGCGVEDAGFCHGAAGLAHVFNRLYQATGDAVLRGAAERWFLRTLDLREPGLGIAAYRAYRREQIPAAWVDDPTLLTGATGIALVLHAATSAEDPSWDRLLLVSSRPPG
jgi:lantibiotic biosynthesis protein